MPELVEVRFKGNRKEFYHWERSAPLAPGDPVLVEAERGQDLGVVSAVGDLARKKCGAGCAGCALGAATPREPKGKILRPAKPEEARTSRELRRAEEDVRRKVLERVRAHQLSMKVSDAEWQWDRRKLTIYFTAEQRVDFRALVRDLAALFRTRIELRQIGARDEAKRLDGVGRCGRQYCCSSWLPELKPVSLALAKDQRLSLNPSQISGGCGRLLCCLRYEHDFYVASRKRFPKEGKLLRTSRGEERVQAVDIFRERVLLRAADGSVRALGLEELKAELAASPEPPAPPRLPPASLVAFDEGSLALTDEAAAATVSPRRRRRRRRPQPGQGPPTPPPARPAAGGAPPAAGAGAAATSRARDPRPPRPPDRLATWSHRLNHRRHPMPLPIVRRTARRPPVSERFYLTTAIDYANGEPHLGHAFEKIGADCIARYRRLRGQQVRLSIGMDENAQNVSQAAEAHGTSPREWVDRIAQQFQQAWQQLYIAYDDFIRTTEPRHQRAVQELLGRIQRAGYIYQGLYRGYYCVGCEAFKLEKDLAGGQCPLHPTRAIQWVEEPNYFFRLSAFGPRLLALYQANPEFVRPRAKLHEIRNVVAGGLQDLSVSRSRLAWGIPWPGDSRHTVYVWFDALINYLSSTGFPEPGYQDWWPAQLHIIGPDIVRFHAAIWPAMLMAAELPVPGGVWAHGWINFSGARFSKTAGVQVSLSEAIARHGPDALRYFLLREIPWDGDGEFSWERFDARYEADLANGYGNLASRVLAMTRRYLGGAVPDEGEPTSLDREGEQVIADYGRAMDQHLLHEAARHAWRLVSRANAFAEETAPWNLAKQGDQAALRRALAALARALARITVLSSPFLPAKSQEVWAALGLPGAVTEARWRDLERPPVAGRTVHHLAPLFPKPASRPTPA